MQTKPIKTQLDYQRALKEIDQIMDAMPNTPQGNRLDALATQVVAWEEKHYAVNAPDLNAAIEYDAQRSAPKTARRG